MCKLFVLAVLIQLFLCMDDGIVFRTGTLGDSLITENTQQVVYQKKRRVDLVLDSSGSISDNAFQNLRRASILLMKMFDETKDEVSLYLFACGVTKIGFNVRPSKARSILSGMQRISGGTATHLALDRIRVDHAGDLQNRTVYLITDGYPNSQSQAQQSADSLRQHGVFVFVIGIGESRNDHVLASLSSYCTRPPGAGDDWKERKCYYNKAGFDDLVFELESTIERYKIIQKKMLRPILRGGMSCKFVDDLSTEKIPCTLSFLVSTESPEGSYVENGFDVMISDSNPPDCSYFFPALCEIRGTMKIGMEKRCDVMLIRNLELRDLEGFPAHFNMKPLKNDDLLLDQVNIANPHVNFSVSIFQNFFKCSFRYGIISQPGDGKSTWTNTVISACSEEVQYSATTRMHDARKGESTDIDAHMTTNAAEFHMRQYTGRYKACRQILVDTFGIPSDISLPYGLHQPDYPFFIEYIDRYVNGTLPIDYHLKEYKRGVFPKRKLMNAPLHGLVYVLKAQYLLDEEDVQRYAKFVLDFQRRHESFPIVVVVACHNDKSCKDETMETTIKELKKWGIPRIRVFDMNPYLEEAGHLEGADSKNSVRDFNAWRILLSLEKQYETYLRKNPNADDPCSLPDTDICPSLYRWFMNRMKEMDIEGLIYGKPESPDCSVDKEMLKHIAKIALTVVVGCAGIPIMLCWCWCCCGRRNNTNNTEPGEQNENEKKKKKKGGKKKKKKKGGKKKKKKPRKKGKDENESEDETESEDDEDTETESEDDDETSKQEVQKGSKEEDEKEGEAEEGEDKENEKNGKEKEEGASAEPRLRKGQSGRQERDEQAVS